MSETRIVFPLSEIQSEFLRVRNDQATALVQDAVRKVAIDCNVPPGVDVAPNKELNALVVVQQPQAASGPPISPEATSDAPAPVMPDLDALRKAVETLRIEEEPEVEDGEPA
jgi:hypothetical protein